MRGTPVLFNRWGRLCGSYGEERREALVLPGALMTARRGVLVSRLFRASTAARL